MATIGTKLFTWLNGKLVGTDDFGNKYYRTKTKEAGAHIGRPNTERRWVIYKGLPEPSKVPPGWHAWLHYMVDDIPSDEDKPHIWEKEWIPNLTGSPLAYRPPGHVSQGGKRAKATGDYVPWNPE